MKRNLFTGHVKDGKAFIDNRRLFDLFMQTLEGKNFNMEVWVAGRKRSSEENRYFHGVILPIVGETFYNLTGEVEFLVDKEYVKDLIKQKFLTTPIQSPDTNEIVAYRVLKTSSLSISEMEDLCEKIRVWMITEFNVRVPLPNEKEGSL